MSLRDDVKSATPLSFDPQALMTAQLQLAGPFWQAYMTAANTAASWWMTQLAPMAKAVAPEPQAPTVVEEPVEAAPAEAVVAQAVAVDEPVASPALKPAPKPRVRKAKVAAVV